MSTGKWKKPTGIEQTTRYKERQLRKASPRERMLHDFLKAKTLTEKRDIIKSFTPYHFAFGYKLDPNNPYEEKHDESGF